MKTKNESEREYRGDDNGEMEREGDDKWLYDCDESEIEVEEVRNRDRERE
jgi:hypothetical protein